MLVSPVHKNASNWLSPFGGSTLFCRYLIFTGSLVNTFYLPVGFLYKIYFPVFPVIGLVFIFF